MQPSAKFELVIDIAQPGPMFHQALVAYLDREGFGYATNPIPSAFHKSEFLPTLPVPVRRTLSTLLVSSPNHLIEWGYITCWCLLPIQYNLMVFADSNGLLYLLNFITIEEIVELGEVRKIEHKQDRGIEKTVNGLGMCSNRVSQWSVLMGCPNGVSQWDVPMGPFMLDDNGMIIFLCCIPQIVHSIRYTSK